MKSMMVFDPRAPQNDLKHSRRGIDGLAGKVVGFIDNAKPNFNYLVDEVADLLVSRHGVAGIVKHRKNSSAVPAPEFVMKDILERCDVVITGSGD